MRNDYRTFVIDPPQLLEEQPQLTDHVVWKALENTFSRGAGAAEVASARTTRLDDGRLRVAAWLLRAPGVTVPQSPYGDAFRYNVHQTAAAVERDGVTYLFTGLSVPRGYLDDPDLRELLVRGAVERTFPELVGQQYRLDHDLHCEVDPSHAGPGPVRFLLDVAVTASARSGIAGRDEDVRYAHFWGHLDDRTRELADLDRDRVLDEVQEGQSDTDRAERVLLPIVVPLHRQYVRPIGDGLGRELIAQALERTFPELRDAEYGFDYDMREDSLHITLSAQPQQAMEQATDAWEVSLTASPTEQSAAVESNLDDVVREALDDVDRTTHARAFTR